MIPEMEPTQTGLVIPIPSLQDLVATWRPKVDAVPPVGAPAHVTLLYPFLPPAAVSDRIDEIRTFLATRPSFNYSLDGVGWFEDEVVFVKPLPADGFMDLTHAIGARWGMAPYGGDVEDPVPHVTIGYGGSKEAMRRVADAAQNVLPIEDQLADEVWLMQGTPDPPNWTQTHRFNLGTARP